MPAMGDPSLESGFSGFGPMLIILKLIFKGYQVKGSVPKVGVLLETRNVGFKDMRERLEEKKFSKAVIRWLTRLRDKRRDQHQMGWHSAQDAVSQ